ncbi:High affinity Ca2+/Mn2+ P-type ATPase-like protein [Cryptotrichosporon argae]
MPPKAYASSTNVRRSPPPTSTSVLTQRPLTPTLSPDSEMATATASSSAYGARAPASRPAAYAVPDLPDAADDGLAGVVGLGGASASAPGVGVGVGAGIGQPSAYAYSTTLRRQVSYGDLGHSGRRTSSPHASLRARAASTGAGAGAAAQGAGYEPWSAPEDDEAPGALERALEFVRRVTGRRAGYDEVEQDEERARRSLERKQRETPSAVYAHKSVEDTIRDFSTHPTHGLAPSSLAALLARYGPNEFELPPTEPLYLKFSKQVYENPLILLLFGSSFVSALMGQYDDAVCVVVAITIVLTVGFVQEQRSEKSLEALNKLVPHFCHLIRDGRPLAPLANTLLPGDLVTFSVGDRVPADVRLISAVALEIDESALTGETRPARKNTTACERGEGEDTHGEGGGKALGERHCMAFMGTLVRSGHGSGIVVGTGKDTEFGVVFAMMQDVEEKRTPLQVSMDDLAKQLSIFSFGVIGVIVLIGIIQRRSWLEMFTIGVSLAVAAIPEGLPIVTTVTLALGVLRMSKRKAIVKKLHSVEALGSVSVICSDKTGTLTKNEMTVTHLYAVDDLLDLSPHLNASQFSPRHPDSAKLEPSPAMLKAVTIGNLCNNAFRNEQGVNVGQATEVALLNVLGMLRVEDERKNFERKAEIPFSSDAKTMTVVGSINAGADMIYLKGAVEAVLARCRYYYVTDSSTPLLDAATRKIVLDRATEVSKRGLRVIAMAYGFAKAGASAETAGELVFAGFEGMMDPPRRGVAHAVGALHGAGVQIVMITGDAEPTALAIARELGLKAGAPAHCMLGSQVDQLNERELVERVADVTVFARTTPRHKMAIVKAWQMRGAVVAMTGDGVNDAPALKMADIGISMGRSGTDVAKEAADVILVDDDFSSILPAVEEGKSIFYNIQNFLSFQLSTAVAALSLITLSTILQLPNPLNAMQILFINILMDGPPAQALGVDPVDREIMRRPPRRKGSSVLSRRVMLRVAFGATLIVLGTLFIYAQQASDGSMSRRDQTMTFTGFVFLDLVSALQSRGLSCALFRNRMLFLAVSVSFVAQLALVYVPPLQHIFQTEALAARDLLLLVGLAATSMAAHEGRRWWERSESEREIRDGTGVGAIA